MFYRISLSTKNADYLLGIKSLDSISAIEMAINYINSKLIKNLKCVQIEKEEYENFRFDSMTSNNIRF